MLEEQIGKDYIQAMKDRDSVRSSTLSFLRAQMKNVIIDKKVKGLSDEDVITVIKKQIKQRQDSIAQFKQGGREDLVQKEQAEADFLSAYLPASLSDEELRAIARDDARGMHEHRVDHARVVQRLGQRPARRVECLREGGMFPRGGLSAGGGPDAGPQGKNAVVEPVETGPAGE
ncbi:MAG TPA: GatB/YqeY domain-containing protein, partial [Candidatus Omnitrophota bacterium]|nr:GatB/YqeY domain-containing protein [Candidatus Omnitrophota bacterium]